MQARIWLAAAYVVLELGGLPASVRELHVAPDGRDDGPGTAAGPWRTIQRAADAAGPGDVVIVHKGLYRETVRPAHSGSAGAPVRFQAAEGEEVLLSGAEPIGNWSVHEGAIHGADVAWPVEQVFLDGRLMVWARTPNAGDDRYKPELTAATVDQRTCTVEGRQWPKDYWKGGVVWGAGRTGWVFGSAPIAGSDGGTLTLAEKIPFFSSGEGKVALFGVMGALDAEREWHQQDGRLYLWAPRGDDPSRHVVEATRRRWAFDLSRRCCIEVSGFDLFAAGVNLAEADHCTVEGCRARFASFDRALRGGSNRGRVPDARQRAGAARGPGSAKTARTGAGPSRGGVGDDRHRHPHERAYDLNAAAIACDFAYNCLTTEEREEITDCVAKVQGIVVPSVGLTGNFNNGPNSNWTAIGVGGAGLASLATLGEKGPLGIHKPPEVQPAFELAAEDEAEYKEFWRRRAARQTGFRKSRSPN